MNRTIRWQGEVGGLGPRAEQLVVAPHDRAARTIGTKAQTLSELAVILLSEVGGVGLKVAPEFTRRQVLQRVVRDLVPGADAVEMSDHLREGVRSLLLAGIDLERLGADESRRVRELAMVTKGYRGRLRELGQVDPAEMFWQAAALDLPRIGLFVYGYFALRADQIELIDRIAGDGSVVILPGNGAQVFYENDPAISLLRDRGWEVSAASEEAWTKSETAIGWEVGRLIWTGGEVSSLVRAFSAATVEAEVREVLRRVASLLASGVSPEEIVLITEDEPSYGQALEAVGWEYGIPVRIDEELPLAAHRIGGWIRLLMEMVGGGFGYESTLGFLCHALSPEPAWERLGEASQWRPVGGEAWRALGIEPCPPGWPASLTGEAPATRSQLAGILESVLPPAITADLPSADLFASRLREGLDELLANMGEGPVTVRQFTFEVIELLGLGRQSVSMVDRGIVLRRPGMVIGGYSRHLFLLGMIDGEMPRSVTTEGILDLYERKRLRALGFPLATAVELVRREKLGLLLAIGTATESITLSLPRMRLGKPTIESGFLAQSGIVVDSLPAGHTTPNPLSIEEARRNNPRGAGPEDPLCQRFQSALAVEYSRELSPDRDQYDGVTGHPVSAENRTWSASQLTRFGQCRFKWFSRHILGVEEESELPIEVTSRQYGRLLHRALELALADLPAGSDPRQWALSRIEDALIAAEVDPENPLYRFPAWEAQRTEWLDRLRRAIQSEWFIRPETQVIGREQKFEESWQGLKVSGSIDRIDRTPEGIEMVDYKTGSGFPRGANDGSGRLKLDLQLPIYIEAAGSRLFPGAKITGRYFSLTSRRNLVRRVDDQSSELTEFTERLRRQLATGDFAVEPDAAEEACSYCEYELICRRGRRLARKSRFDSTEEEEL